MSCNCEKFDYAGDDILVFRTTITPGTTAFSVGDIVGGLYEIQNAVSCNGGTAEIVGAWITEKSGTASSFQTPTAEVYFFNKTSTPPANNAPFVLSAFTSPAYDGADLAGAPLVGTVSAFEIDTVWQVIKWATLISQRLQAAASTTSLFCAVRLDATATFTSGSTLELVLHLRRN